MSRLRELYNASFTLILLVFSSCAHAELQAFHYDSLQSIERAYQGQPFLLVLWSLECPPCRAELKMLGALKQQYPHMRLVLVAADETDRREELDTVLAAYQLQSLESSWVFAEKNIERLRYGIDPTWYGEMPRSYFYDASHQRKGVSGKLSRETIVKWLSGSE